MSAGDVDEGDADQEKRPALFGEVRSPSTLDPRGSGPGACRHVACKWQRCFGRLLHEWVRTAYKSHLNHVQKKLAIPRWHDNKETKTQERRSVEEGTCWSRRSAKKRLKKTQLRKEIKIDQSQNRTIMQWMLSRAATGDVEHFGDPPGVDQVPWLVA